MAIKNPNKYIVQSREPLPLQVVTASGRLPRCYVGVSVGHPNFRGRRLRALLEWLLANVHETCLVIGDDLHRLTFAIERGHNGEESLRLARDLGTSHIVELHRQLLGLPIERFRILRWADVSGHHAFSPCFAKLSELFASSPRFRESVRASADDFLARREARGRRPAATKGLAQELSCRYLLEEMAGFCALVADGWTVDVYPGPELPTLKEAAQGAFAGIPLELRQRINVEIDVRPTKSTQGSEDE